jgi:hypothetical protein
MFHEQRLLPFLLSDFMLNFATENRIKKSLDKLARANAIRRRYCAGNGDFGKL